MVRLRLDAKGRLIALEARPFQDNATSALIKAKPAVRADWPLVFRLAELDPERFSPAEPITVPPSAFDSRAAWTGTFSESRPERVRVEAASWEAKPVYFVITGEWEKITSTTGPYSFAVEVALAALLVLDVVGSALLAIRNLHRLRTDLKGAGTIAIIGFGLTLSSGVLAAAHIASLWELHILLKALSWSGVAAGLLSLLYLAIEPYVRRHWPEALISWSRFRAGRIRDSLVASHLLIGISTVMAYEVVFWAVFALGSGAIRTWQPLPVSVQSLNGSGRFVAVLLSQISTGLFLSIALLLVVVIVRLVIRRLWLADLVAAALISMYVFVAFNNPIQNVIAGVLNIGFIYIVLWMLPRFGLMAALAAVITDQVVTGTVPIGLSSWYAGPSLVTLAVPATVAGWALWVIAAAHRTPQRKIA